MKYKFSIILPTYNRISLLGRAIKSVLNQSFFNFELIIINDGSNDGTLEYLGSINDSRVHVINKISPKGVSAARNSGIKSATGSIIAFLDDDDELLPDFLLKHNINFSNHQELGWSWSGITRIFWHDAKIIKEEVDQCWFIADSKKRYLTQLAASYGVVVRKNLIDKVGLFDENMTVAEDLDFLMRLEMSGAVCAPFPEVLIRIHIHSGLSLSRGENYRLFVQSYRILIKKNMPLMEMHPLLWRHQHDSLLGHLYRVGDTKAARSLVWSIFSRYPWRFSGLGKFFRFETKRFRKPQFLPN